MQIILTEEDFKQSLGTNEAKRLVGKQKEAILGDGESGNAHAILDALPRVLVDRIRKMIPPDYEVQQVEIKVQISGQPFGVGIGGDATVTFGPKNRMV